ncbi:MAG: hypothetical protein QOI04_1677 [Verrucomicrobiota bacterium]|jgi:hypothetical protein
MSREHKLPRRAVFVLTPEEKRTVVFVLCAVILGLAAKHYRDAHPQLPAKIDIKHSRSHSQIYRPSPSPTAMDE